MNILQNRDVDPDGFKIENTPVNCFPDVENNRLTLVSRFPIADILKDKFDVEIEDNDFVVRSEGLIKGKNSSDYLTYIDFNFNRRETSFDNFLAYQYMQLSKIFPYLTVVNLPLLTEMYGTSFVRVRSGYLVIEENEQNIDEPTIQIENQDVLEKHLSKVANQEVI